MRIALHEIQYAVRRLRGSPMFTIAATLTLAIAIGATTSVFSLVDTVLLKSFPYHAPDRVLTLWESNEAQHQPHATVATGNYLEWQAQNQSFSALAATCCDGLWFTVIRPQDAERVNGLAVTPSYFPVLGITPVIGRPLAADTSGPNEIVLSYGYWQRRFGGAPSVLGRRLTLDNANDARPAPRHTYTIVGVMPPGLPGDTDMWTLIFFEPSEKTEHDFRYLHVYGRLKPGVTTERAQGDLETIAGRLAVAYPKTNEDWSVATTPLLDHLVGQVRPALVMLLSAAGCVLLIGAANLANLFLVRCLARERELAVRTALGATRGHIVGELVAEGAILGLGAGSLGVGLAVGGIRLLAALAPHTLPRLQEIGIDSRVMAFCAVTSLATVFVFGVLPAWRVSGIGLASVLKEGGRGTGSAQQHRLQDTFVVLQVAVALILLTGAGLLVESFAHFVRMDPGFRPQGVLTARVTLTSERYPTPERRRLFFVSLLDRLAVQPGITAASASGWLPAYPHNFAAQPFAIVGDPPLDLSRAPAAASESVSPQYFRTLGIKLLRGRSFLPSDRDRAVSVVAVDELVARRYFAGRDPIGKHIITLGGHDTSEVVGVVASVKEFGLAADDVGEIYRPFTQGGGSGAAFIAVRTMRSPVTAAAMLKQVVADVDPIVPISDIETMSERMMQSVATTRFSTLLASLFAAVAVVLGMVGIYSVLAYIVSQRQREIAIRVALGASSAHVMAKVLRRALALTGAGVAVGSLAAWMVTRALAGLFLGVSPHDPAIFIGAAGLFALVALAAAAVPAFRTTRVNPVVALTSS